MINTLIKTKKQNIIKIMIIKIKINIEKVVLPGHILSPNKVQTLNLGPSPKIKAEKKREEIKNTQRKEISK